MFISEAALSSLPSYLTRKGNGYMRVLLGVDKRQRTPIQIFDRCHRLVLYFMWGPPPDDDQVWMCCHICGNKSCLNPFHLVWGLSRDNKEDSLERYRVLADQQGHPKETIPENRPRRVV